MNKIDSINVLQLLPVQRPTWAVYGCENNNEGDVCKFTAEEVECWAVIENIYECQPWDAPLLYVGGTPCVRATEVRGLHLEDLKYFGWERDPDLLGYTHSDPSHEIERWNRASENHFARRKKSA
jgi:hypothetical protein